MSLFNKSTPHSSDAATYAALDALPLPVWHLNTDGRLVACNPAYAALYGLTPDQAVEQQKIMARATGRVHVVVAGTRRLFAATLQDSGNHKIGLAQDISREEELSSEHKRTQTATKELLEQLRTAIATFTADQKLEFFNSAFAQLWDLDDQWLNGRPKLGEILEKLREMRRLPEQADFRRYKQMWLDMFTNLIDPFEDLMHLPSGGTLRVLVVPNPSGGLMMTFEDVTSRLELESSYNTLVAVQRETLDNLNEGIAVFGGDGRLKLSNPAYGRMWHLHPEDMVDEPHISKLVERLAAEFTPLVWAGVRDRILATVLNGTETNGQLVLKDDRQITYATVILPDGGVLISYIDVTDSVRVEKALREKNTALEAAERLKLDFLANVSYQLRTPLNAIMGFNEILDQQFFGPMNEKQQQYTKGIGEASSRLLELIDDILDLSTIEAGYMKLEYGRVNVVELLTNLQVLTIDWARKEGLDVVLDIAGEPGHFEADPRRLKQIILNLIRNAIAFTPSGGSITLSAVRSDKEMVITVQDTGSGILAVDQERIFEPFERGMNADQRDAHDGPSGAGLGLSLVRNIAELHGGRVVLDSTPGVGTKVSIILPVSK